MTLLVGLHIWWVDRKQDFMVPFHHTRYILKAMNWKYIYLSAFDSDDEESQELHDDEDPADPGDEGDVGPCPLLEDREAGLAVDTAVGVEGPAAGGQGGAQVLQVQAAGGGQLLRGLD